MCSFEKQDIFTAAQQWHAGQHVACSSLRQHVTLQLFVYSYEMKNLIIDSVTKFVMCFGSEKHDHRSFRIVFEVGVASKTFAKSESAQIDGATGTQRFAYITNSARLSLIFFIFPERLGKSWSADVLREACNMLPAHHCCVAVKHVLFSFYEHTFQMITESLFHMTIVSADSWQNRDCKLAHCTQSYQIDQNGAHRRFKLSAWTFIVKYGTTDIL